MISSYSAIRYPLSVFCRRQVAVSGQIFQPKSVFHQQESVFPPASHGPAMSDEQPKSEPQSPKQQADKSVARTAQHNDLFALRLGHTYHGGGENDIHLGTAALQQFSRLSVSSGTRQKKI